MAATIRAKVDNRPQHFHEREKADGQVHIRSAHESIVETLCGFCDSGLVWEEVAGAVTCRECAGIYAYCRALPALKVTK